MKKAMGCCVVLMLAACSGSDQVGVSVRAGAPRTGASVLRQGLTLDNGIEVSRVRMVIEELDLEMEGEAKSVAGAEDESLDETEVEAGPFLVDLSGAALAGEISQVLEADVATGHYTELKIKIHKIEGEAARSDARFADMVQGDASVIIDGKIDGAAFSFVSSLDEEQEREASFDIGQGAANITLNLDITKWFTDSSGQRLDPREATNRSAIEENIKSSIDAFDDDDHDGSEDHDDDDDVSGGAD